MCISAIVEPVSGRGYRASCGQPFDLSAEGTTIEEAVGLLKAQVQGKMDSGARIVDFDVKAGNHAWAPFAGMFENDPLFEEWQQVIAENRRRAALPTECVLPGESEFHLTDRPAQQNY